MTGMKKAGGALEELVCRRLNEKVMRGPSMQSWSGSTLVRREIDK